MDDQFVWPSDAARAESDELNRVCEYAEHLYDQLEAVGPQMVRIIFTDGGVLETPLTSDMPDFQDVARMELMKPAGQAARAQGGEGVEPVYQWQVRGSDHWNDCSEAEYRRLSRKLPIDQRILYTHPQPAQQGVPEGVWEALQRLIENGGQMGPASREDALLVARHRHHLMTTPQPEGDWWIKCSERLPTEADANEHGNIRWRRSGVGCHGRYDEIPVDADAWKPTALKRPQPPKEGE